MAAAPDDSSSSLSALECALLDNLAARGVLRGLRAAVLACVLDVLAADGDEAAPTRPRATDPDTLLSRSLVADFLRASGCRATLAVFEAETGAASAPTALPLPAAQPQSARFGAIVAEAITKRVAGEAVSAAAAALGGEGGAPTPAAAGPTARAVMPGFLAIAATAAELALDDSEGRTPLLEALVRRAREERLAHATAARSWLNSVRPVAATADAASGAQAPPAALPGAFVERPPAQAWGGGFAGGAPITILG